ncbi:DNA glycosylase [[Emmonsia] crescens]|uniref:DNA glycosylase n=1 Tax=[Emmonsia] crescens TaxID=73230 RepID=A0A0G2HNF9_9EURO|nr:DNA glycosylase [Emmonsia crescens UAMH 3008]
MINQTLESLSHEGQVTPLWLDCDPGEHTKDAFAILLAAHHRSLKLLGISTVYGNGSLKNTTVNAGSILEAIGRSDIPVYPGAAKPFCRAAVHAPDIHGMSGLDGTDLLPAPTRPPMRNSNAIVAMRDALLAQPKNTAWLVATGTLTNVGLLFATFPEVAEHVRGVSIMGGAIGSGFSDAPICKRAEDEARIGNITHYAEFNIYCDPESAKSIFSSPVLAPKTILIPLDLTHQVLGTPRVQSLILQTEPQPVANGNGVNHTPSVLRQILHALLIYFANTYESVFGLDVGPPLHDPVAVAVLLSNLNNSNYGSKNPGFLYFDDRDGERFLVNVVTDGQHGSDLELTGEVGRTHASPLEHGECGVTIPRRVDVDAFWNIVLDCLRRADDWNASRANN